MKSNNFNKRPLKSSPPSNRVKQKMDSNEIISTTANEVSGVADSNTCAHGSSSLSQFPGGRGCSDRDRPREGSSQESISYDYTMRSELGAASVSHFSGYYTCNYMPFLVNHSGPQSSNTYQRFEQRSYSDFSAQGLRNVCLFRDETPHSIPRRNFSDNVGSRNEARDKEIVRNLRMWTPTDLSTTLYMENNSNKPGLEFTLMSYNVLAQDLLTEHAYLYRNHNPKALLWEYRWKNLYQEILNHDADIICLQEVQESHIAKYFSRLNQKGYAYIFKKRTGMRSDGCALYYKKSVFKLIENTTVEYNQGNVVLDRDNVAIIAKLIPKKQPQQEFVVATTHLLYNPKRQDVRLAQSQVLLAEVERMAYKGQEQQTYTPIIITGDFNSEPNSAVYQLIVNGKLRYDNLSNRTLLPTNANHGLAGKFLIPAALRITDNCQHLDLLAHRAVNTSLPRAEEVNVIRLRHSKRPKPKALEVGKNDTLFSTGVLSHDLNLRSAFLHQIGNDTEGTTHQDRWITVDYIFYSGAADKEKQTVVDGKLKLLARYSIPTTEQLEKVRNIPNFALGSDHLALLAKFKLEY